VSEEICEFSGLPDYSCAHCLEQDLPDPYEGLVVRNQMEAKFDGRCSLDVTHKLYKGQDISLVGLADEPSHKVIGWVCTRCATLVRVKNGSFEVIPGNPVDRGVFDD
jgi:hypothetical protein